MALDRPALRKWLGTAFPSDADLDAFCIDYFPSIHARFTAGMDRVQKVTILLQHTRLDELEQRLREATGGAPHAQQPSPPNPELPFAMKGELQVCIKVLFLASLPSSVARLDLGVEIRKIQDRIQSAKYRDRIQMQSEWAVRPSDIRQALLKYLPHIVHFSGHGEAGALIVEDDDGSVKPIAKTALGELFGLLKENIRVVLLNACYSRVQAEAIGEHIDCVIGMNRPVGDKAAITFAAAFYEAIGYGHSVQKAFDLAKNAISLEGIPGQDIPELLVRPGIHAADLRLLG
jgi:hypothetical protein